MALYYTENQASIFVKKNILTFFVFFIFFTSTAQTNKVDSLNKLLAVENIDSNRVKLLYELEAEFEDNNPDTAYYIAQSALNIAKASGFENGIAMSYSMIANYFSIVGNYPKALEFYFKRLKVEEKLAIPQYIASANMGIATVYYLMDEHLTALSYALKADKVIKDNDLQNLKLYSTTNLGDIYLKLKNIDSSIFFANQTLTLAKSTRDDKFIGVANNNLGNIYLEKGYYELAKKFYLDGLPYLIKDNNDDFICETNIGLAKLYEKTGMNDSAQFYAHQSLALAKTDGFQAKVLNAYTFFTEHFEKNKKIDSAFFYQAKMISLNDSLSSKERIRESAIISIDEKFRQQEIEDNRKKEKKELNKRLQLLLIGISIPMIFLLTLFLNRQKIHPKIIRFLGIISLLLLFEYLTLVLHPIVAELTHHTPILELLIFVCLAAVLVPAHHKIQFWLIEKITHSKIEETIEVSDTKE